MDGQTAMTATKYPPIGALWKVNAGDQPGAHNQVICEKRAEVGVSLATHQRLPKEAISGCGRCVVKCVLSYSPKTGI